MFRWWRPLVMTLLMLAVPVQGWATAHMSGQMAAHRASLPASHMASSHLHHAAMSPESTHTLVSMDEAEHPACCPGDAGMSEHGESGFNHCADTCHCCVMAALPQAPGTPAPMATSHRGPPHTAVAFSGSDTATPDKPPKS